APEAFSRAGQAWGRALSLEPELAPRLEQLARRALRLGHGAEAQAFIIREALRHAIAGSSLPPPRSARLLLALGRVERDLGDPLAGASFARYLASNDNRPLALLELGRTQLLHGDLTGAARY